MFMKVVRSGDAMEMNCSPTKPRPVRSPGSCRRGHSTPPRRWLTNKADRTCMQIWCIREAMEMQRDRRQDQAHSTTLDSVLWLRLSMQMGLQQRLAPSPLMKGHAHVALFMDVHCRHCRWLHC